MGALLIVVAAVTWGTTGATMKLVAAGSLLGESDHGVSKSLYAADPDGIEFEVMWAVPKESWPSGPSTERLDLDAELARWAAVDTADQ